MTNQNENENTEQPADDETPAANEAANDGANDATNDAEVQAELDQEIADAQSQDDNVEEIHDPVAELEDTVADLKDRLLRALSEAENTRRIATREKADASKYAIAGFARDLLGVIDNMTMALSSIPAEAREADANLNNLFVGIEMTMQELVGSFERNSIKPIDAMDKQFDHNLMEALQQIPNPDVAEGTVVQVIRPGFSIHDRLLRPAQVLVATGGPKPQTAQTPQADVKTEADETEESQGSYEKTAPDPGASVDQET